MTWVISIFILLAVIVIHEGGHALAALAVGVPIKEFAIGFPYPSVKIGKIRISPFLIMAGVIIDDEEYYKTPAWKKIVISLAGPVANLVTGALTIFLFFGVAKGSYLITAFITAGFQSIVMLFTGKIPLTELVSPIGIVEIGNSLSNQYVLWKELFWLLLSFLVPIINLLPIPALDGGQVLMALAIGAGKNSAKVISLTKKITLAFFLILTTGIIFLAVRDVIKLF